MSSFTRFLVFLGVLLLPLGNVAAQDDAYHSWLRSHLETEYGVTGGDWVLAGPTTVFEIDEETSGWVGVDADGNEVFSDDPRDLDDYSTTWIAEMAVDQSESAEVIPASYELQWSDPADSVNTSVSYPGGYVEMTLPVWCTNLDTGSACDLLVLDGDGDGAFDRSDELVITEREGFAPRRFRARVSFRKPILTDDVAPEAGARLRVSVAAPEGEAYQETFTLDHTAPSGVLVEQLDAEADRPFSRFARFTVSNPTPASPWQQAVRWPITAPVGGSDVLLAAIWLRGTSGSGMTPRLTVIFEMAGSPHTKSLNAPYTLADDWHLFLIPFELEAGYAPDEARFQLNLGFAEQTVDVGGLALLDYGNRYTVDELPFQVPSLGYDGQAPDAAWRADAEARIREHRMADLEIRVVDAAGNPVEGAAVEVEMQRHAFGFGSAVTAQMLAAGGSDNDRYRDIVDSYFNRVVFENDLKWKPWLAAQSNSHGSYRMTYLDEAIEWLRARDIEIRGHYLMWAPTGRWQPDQYLTDGSTLREATIEHIGEKLAWTEGRIDEWDAVNHIVANFGESTYDAMLGSNEIYLEVVRLGNELAPQAEIYVNEGNIIAGGGEADDYEAMIEWLISQDAPLDGIGFMGHFDGGDIVHPDMVYDRIDRFAAFDKLLQFTELDVDVGRDDSLQADYLRDVIITAFSHPQMDGIVMWGFWEGRHWKPDAALWREDWTIKPAGEAWIDLVFDRWWTSETLQSDAAGEAALRGFKGEYEITVEHDGIRVTQPVELSDETGVVEVSLTEATGVEEAGVPDRFALESVYPNPFNPETTLVLAAREAGNYSMRVYDVLGRVVHTRQVEAAAPGRMRLQLNMKDHSSGPYFVQVEQEKSGAVVSARIVLAK